MPEAIETPIFTDVCAWQAMNVHVCTESYKNSRSIQCMCVPLNAQNPVDREVLCSPQSLSLAHCLIMGKLLWASSSGLGAENSSLARWSHRTTIYLANITALTWKGKILFGNMPGNFKDCVCARTHTLPYLHMQITNGAWMLLWVVFQSPEILLGVFPLRASSA